MRVLAILSIVAGLSAAPGHAYTVEKMWAEFDASSLGHDEKRFLQIALAFEGNYAGLMDGAWGEGSQGALERWAVQNDLDLPVENWEVVVLAFENLERFATEGWQQQFFEPMDMSFAVPAGQLRPGTDSDIFLNYDHANSTLRYSLTIDTLPQVMRLHDYALGSALAVSEPYMLRRDSVKITSVEQPEGNLLYVRSDLRRNGWATIVLSAAVQDRNILNAVSGSISKAQSADFDLPADGPIMTGIASMAVILNDKDNAETPPPDEVASGLAAPPAPVANVPGQPVAAVPPAEPAAPRKIGTGTAFIVSAQGHLLTNAHVVDGCDGLLIDGRPVTLVMADAGFDLALIRDRPAELDDVAAFAPQPAPLNADITIAGYPLKGILSGLNVTRGSVTSLKGLGGDAATMQISAPVQPGNSGGPAVNAMGQIVGVVVSKLDAKLVADETGDIPQNVNFAIRGEIAKLFLFQNGVEPVLAQDSATPLPPEDLARRLEQMTRLVECRADPG